ICLAVALVAALVWSLLARPSRQRAALAVDRRLGGYDRVTTALELGEATELTREEARQLDSASAWADTRDVSGVARLRPDRSAVGLSLLAVAVLAALVLVPAPTDVALAQRQADRDAIAEEADRLRELAEEAPEEVADRLEELIEELTNAPDIESALDVLGEARQDL